MGGLLLLLLLAACSRDPEADTVAEQTAASQTAAAPQPTQTPRTGAIFPTATSTPTPTNTPEPSPTPTLTPTPIVASLSISDQSVNEAGTVIVDTIAVPEPAWVVVYTADGEIIGQTAVESGVHDTVSIAVDPLSTTPNMTARLHTDAEPLETFDFPGADEPLSGEVTSFAVTLDLPNPMIQVNDQNVGEDGVVQIATVYVPDPAWLLIRDGRHDEIGAPVGQLYLEAGLHENFPITINWREASPSLFAVLHEDNERPQRLDYPAADLPLQMDGEPVAAAFTATYPPDILVYDQPVIDGQVIIERAISNGPGWVVVHFADENGAPGLVIGYAPLEDGLNERIEIELIESAVTPVLFTRLHEDTVPGDAFNYPAVDGPLREADGRLPRAISFNTQAGSYLIAADQPLDGDGTITISLIVGPSPLWVVIYNDDEGQPDTMLARLWLRPGIHRQISIAIDPSQPTERLHAILHQDGDEPQVFDFPDGADVPLIRNGAPVAISFQVQPPPEPNP